MRSRRTDQTGTSSSTSTTMGPNLKHTLGAPFEEKETTMLNKRYDFKPRRQTISTLQSPIMSQMVPLTGRNIYGYPTPVSNSPSMASSASLDYPPGFASGGLLLTPSDMPYRAARDGRYCPGDYTRMERATLSDRTGGNEDDELKDEEIGEPIVYDDCTEVEGSLEARPPTPRSQLAGDDDRSSAYLPSYQPVHPISWEHLQHLQHPQLHVEPPTSPVSLGAADQDESSSESDPDELAEEEESPERELIDLPGEEVLVTPEAKREAELLMSFARTGPSAGTRQGAKRSLEQIEITPAVSQTRPAPVVRVSTRPKRACTVSPTINTIDLPDEPVPKKRRASPKKKQVLSGPTETLIDRESAAVDDSIPVNAAPGRKRKAPPKKRQATASIDEASASASSTPLEAADALDVLARTVDSNGPNDIDQPRKECVRLNKAGNRQGIDCVSGQTFKHMLFKSIEASPNRCLYLDDIYSGVGEIWPYYATLEGHERSSFQNSIRHNLSIHPWVFQQPERDPERAAEKLAKAEARALKEAALAANVRYVAPVVKKGPKQGARQAKGYLWHVRDNITEHDLSPPKEWQDAHDLKVALDKLDQAEDKVLNDSLKVAELQRQIVAMGYPKSAASEAANSKVRDLPAELVLAREALAESKRAMEVPQAVATSMIDAKAVAYIEKEIKALEDHNSPMSDEAIKRLQELRAELGPAMEKATRSKEAADILPAVAKARSDAMALAAIERIYKELEDAHTTNSTKAETKKMTDMKIKLVKAWEKSAKSTQDLKVLQDKAAVREAEEVKSKKGMQVKEEERLKAEGPGGGRGKRKST